MAARGRRGVVALCLLTAAFVTTGCGGDDEPTPDPAPAKTLCLIDRGRLDGLAEGSELRASGSVDSAKVRRQAGADCQVLDGGGDTVASLTVTDAGAALDTAAVTAQVRAESRGLRSRCSQSRVLSGDAAGYVCVREGRTTYVSVDQQRLLRLTLSPREGSVSVATAEGLAASFDRNADAA